MKYLAYNFIIIPLTFNDTLFYKFAINVKIISEYSM